MLKFGVAFAFHHCFGNFSGSDTRPYLVVQHCDPPLSRYRVLLYLSHLRFQCAIYPPKLGVSLNWGGVGGGGIAAQACPLRYRQGGAGTEPEPETGTVRTVLKFAGTERGTGTAGTVFQDPKPEPEPSSLWNCTETHKTPLLRGTAGTENRNRSNRSIP